VEYLRPTDDATATVAALREWLAADARSSGAPKRVVLPRSAVLASARATSRRLGESGPWSLVLPASYVAGVQVLVRCLLGGHEPVLDGWGDAAYTSLVPTQLHRMLTSAEDLAALRSMRAVLLGGGPLDPVLRHRAEDAGLRVVDPTLATESLLGGPNPLTDRERDVLREALKGAPVAMIAARVHLSQGTVRNYLSAAIGKTGTSTRVEAAQAAQQRGWL